MTVDRLYPIRPAHGNQDSSSEEDGLEEVQDAIQDCKTDYGLYVATITALALMGGWFGIKFWITSFALFSLLFLFNPKDGKRLNMGNLLHSLDAALLFSILFWVAIWCGEKVLASVNPI